MAAAGPAARTPRPAAPAVAPVVPTAVTAAPIAAPPAPGQNMSIPRSVVWTCASYDEITPPPSPLCMGLTCRVHSPRRVLPRVPFNNSANQRPWLLPQVRGGLPFGERSGTALGQCEQVRVAMSLMLPSVSALSALLIASLYSLPRLQLVAAMLPHKDINAVRRRFAMLEVRHVCKFVMSAQVKRHSHSRSLSSTCL